MQKRGQIEDADTKQLLKEIDAKIFKIHNSFPQVNMIA